MAAIVSGLSATVLAFAVREGELDAAACAAAPVWADGEAPPEAMRYTPQTAVARMRTPAQAWTERRVMGDQHTCTVLATQTRGRRTAGPCWALTRE